MILKIIGCAVAVATSVIAAGSIVSAEKRRTAQLYALARLTEHIGRQIENFSTPISEILRTADPSLLHECGSSSPATVSFGDFIKGCDLALSEEEKRTLFAFSAELGRGFKDEQVKSCTLCSAQLRALADSAAEQLPKKRKVTYTLFVCSALALVIILA